MSSAGMLTSALAMWANLFKPKFDGEMYRGLDEAVDSAKVILLFTPQHTGTNFCKVLLETHPQISYCVTQRMVKTASAPQPKVLGYVRGELSDLNWRRLMAEELRGRRQSMSNLFFYHMWQLGIPTPPKKKPVYFFFHDHIHAVFSKSLKDPNCRWLERFSQIEMIVTIRDPLLSILSALRRTNQGERNAQTILDGIEYASRIPGCHYFCTDLPEPVEKKLAIFEKLKLKDEGAGRAFLEKYPLINQTVPRRTLLGEIKRRYFNPSLESSFQMTEENLGARPDFPELSEKYLKSLREARRLLIDKNEAHDCLRPWIKRLQDNPLFEDFYRRLGYRGLVWFRSGG